MNAAMELFLASLSAAACWALWFYFLKEQRVDSLREDLFSLRDELFRLALREGVAFDHPGYTKLRQILNGMIRFAHRISLPTLVVATRVVGSETEPFSPSAVWRASLSDLPEASRDKLEEIHMRMMLRCTKHLIQGSIILNLVALALTITLAMMAVARHFFRLKAQTQTLQNQIILDIAESFDVGALEAKAYQEREAAEDLDLQPA